MGLLLGLLLGRNVFGSALPCAKLSPAFGARTGRALQNCCAQDEGNPVACHGREDRACRGPCGAQLPGRSDGEYGEELSGSARSSFAFILRLVFYQAVSKYNGLVNTRLRNESNFKRRSVSPFTRQR